MFDDNAIKGNTLTFHEAVLILKEFTINKKLYPVEHAALFHLKFKGIHSFVDGNGRTGRLVLNLVLMQAGYLPVNVKYSDCKRYYESFDTYYQNNSQSGMIGIITDLPEERLTQYLEVTKEA